MVSITRDYVRNSYNICLKCMANLQNVSHNLVRGVAVKVGRRGRGERGVAGGAGVS